MGCAVSVTLFSVFQLPSVSEFHSLSKGLWALYNKRGHIIYYSAYSISFDRSSWILFNVIRNCGSARIAWISGSACSSSMNLSFIKSTIACLICSSSTLSEYVDSWIFPSTWPGDRHKQWFLDFYSHFGILVDIQCYSDRFPCLFGRLLSLCCILSLTHECFLCVPKLWQLKDQAQVIFQHPVKHKTTSTTDSYSINGLSLKTKLHDKLSHFPTGKTTCRSFSDCIHHRHSSIQMI